MYEMEDVLRRCSDTWQLLLWQSHLFIFFMYLYFSHLHREELMGKGSAKMKHRASGDSSEVTIVS